MYIKKCERNQKSVLIWKFVVIVSDALSKRTPNIHTHPHSHSHTHMCDHNMVGSRIQLPVLTATLCALVYRPINENGMEQWLEKPLNIA